MTLVGQKIGKYNITDLIARGGMAHIYKAKQPGLGRDVAIKVLLNYLSHNDQFVTRFKREAESITLLRHPNIIRLFDMDIEDGHYYMVMEYMGGGDLHNLLRQHGKLTPTQALDILIPVVDAIACAHDVGIVHRDIKPCNILFAKEPGKHPVITDFGITLMQGSMRLTGSGNYLGTPIYMSPESGLGEPVDHQTDIYSLGVTMYELLTGSFPFDGNTPSEIFFSKLYDPLPDFDLVMPHVPTYVRDIIVTALKSDKTQRYQTASEMKQAMQIARAELALASVPLELLEPQPTKLAPITISTPIYEEKEKSSPITKHKWFFINAFSFVTAGIVILICALFLLSEIPESEDNNIDQVQVSVVEWADSTDVFLAISNNITSPTTIPKSTAVPTLTSIPPPATVSTATISLSDVNSGVSRLVNVLEPAFQQMAIQIKQDMIAPTVFSYELTRNRPVLNHIINDNEIHQFYVSGSSLSSQSLIVINQNISSEVSYTFKELDNDDVIVWSESFLTGICLEIPQKSTDYQLTIQSNDDTEPMQYEIALEDGDLATTECTIQS